MNYRLVFILLFLYLAVSCNIYSFKGSLPPNINSICITPVLNTTSEFSLTNILNESVRQKLIAHNILDVVNISDADSKLDLEPFLQCMNSNNYQDVITQSNIDAKALGISGTPAFFINDNEYGEIRIVNGAQPYEVFERVFNSILEK